MAAAKAANKDANNMDAAANIMLYRKKTLLDVGFVIRMRLNYIFMFVFFANAVKQMHILTGDVI